MEQEQIEEIVCDLQKAQELSLQVIKDTADMIGIIRETLMIGEAVNAMMMLSMLEDTLHNGIKLCTPQEEE